MNSIELLFTDFAKGLESASVRHCFLRGHTNFPELAPLSDVDMLVHPQDRDQAVAVFEAAARGAGFHIWQEFRSGFITRIFSYVFAQDSEHHFFDLDIHTSEATYGIPYLSAEDLLVHALPGDPVSHLPEPLGAMVNCLGHYFAGGLMPEKYREPWATKAGDEVSQSLLVKALGSGDAEPILQALQSDPAASVLSDGRRVGRRARWRLVLRRPCRSILGFLSFGWGERVQPFFRPRGRFLVFLGTDGSGKSTLVAELIKRVGPRFRDGTVESHHLRPGILPQISSLFHGGRPNYTIEDMVDPHRAEPSGLIGSAFRATYYWLDYFIGYPLRILPKRSRNSLIVFDRWFYDYLVDPLRFRVSLRSSAPWLLQKFLPKPDRILICTAPPEQILARKQELSPAEVSRQVEQFQRLEERLSRATIIDTTQDLDCCVDAIIHSVFGDPGGGSDGG
jgi:thymidylate kinase